MARGNNGGIFVVRENSAAVAVLSIWRMRISYVAVAPAAGAYLLYLSMCQYCQCVIVNRGVHRASYRVWQWQLT